MLSSSHALQEFDPSFSFDKSDSLEDSTFPWAGEAWYSSGAAQLPTPVSPSSMSTDSPGASHTYSENNVRSDLQQQTGATRSFNAEYKYDPREPRSLPQVQRLSGGLPNDTHPSSVTQSFPPSSASSVAGVTLKAPNVLQPPFYPNPSSSQQSSSVPPSDPSALQRNARKAKAHVASACYNCKRAHLACDHPRPCPRCVATNKQDSCYDVPHKKRGRPRIKESKSQYGKAARTNTHMNHAAETRYNPYPTYDSYARGDHTRVLKSQTDQYGFVGQRPSSSASLQSFMMNYDPRTTAHPIAFLNTDLEIVRVNRMFSKIFGSALELRGKNVDAIVDMNHRQRIMMIREKFKEEKSARSGGLASPLDVLGDSNGIPDVEHTDYQHYSCNCPHTESFYFYYANGQNQSLQVTFDLIRINAWFVVLKLPLFMEPQAQPTQQYQFSSMPSGGAAMMSYANGFGHPSVSGYAGFGGAMNTTQLPQHQHQQASAATTQPHQHSTPHSQAQQHAMTGFHNDAVHSQTQQMRPLSPSAPVLQSPMYTYAMPSPTMGGSKASYDGSYMSAANSFQAPYQSNMGPYSQTNMQMQNFAAADPRSQGYFAPEQSANSTSAALQANVHLPPLSSQQQQQQQHPPHQPRGMANGNGSLMQPGQGIGLSLGGAHGGAQYFAQQPGSAHAQSRPVTSMGRGQTDADDQDQLNKRIQIREVVE